MRPVGPGGPYNRNQFMQLTIKASDLVPQQVKEHIANLEQIMYIVSY
jgi:hypothetical protein